MNGCSPVMVRLVLLVLVLLMKLPPELQVVLYLVMIPLRCERIGRDQERLMLRDVTVMEIF